MEISIDKMSDSILEEDSTSNTKLIEMQHVGVTAKIRSPLRNLLTSTSFSNASEQDTILFHGQRTTYDKFSNSSQFETETDTSKILYEMRTNQTSRLRPPTNKLTPARIEFQLYRKPRKMKIRRHRSVLKKRGVLTKEEKESKTVLKRIITSLTMMISSKPKKSAKQLETRERTSKAQLPTKPKQLSTLLDIEENSCKDNFTQTLPADINVGIYYFDHGSGDFLSTTDCPPRNLSDVFAAKATHCATRFWSEIFGTLHIGVGFAVTFFLQTYRFVLYSLINTLLVGFLHMTSDYLVKPLLTVFFNGFLQPVLIFILNVFTSFRDILAPVADNVNNFMQPLATLGRSLRLVDINNAQRKTEKEV